jgi:hypothetical protein
MSHDIDFYCLCMLFYVQVVYFFIFRLLQEWNLGGLEPHNYQWDLPLYVRSIHILDTLSQLARHNRRGSNSL